MKINKTLDCAGLFCPMPLVKTKLEMEDMRPGQVIEVTADDPGFEKDLPAWCNMAGEEFLEIKKEGTILKGYVRKK
ncbi:MAG: sulfurtransferase TusA family protein [Elusimicrobia bacterium]|nr:sulfurtransferase TusA family protein [Elusimicrobiota bacterium]